jgi:CBS domain containing-hemolysin-like protein
VYLTKRTLNENAIIKINTMTVVKLFGTVADIIAQMAPEKIVNLKAPEEMSIRVEELVNKKKSGGISEEESFELERILSLDLFIGLAKARARKILAK